MPIDTRHPDYSDWFPEWMLCSDFVEGSRTVKDKGKKYLPRPTGMTAYEYEAFKDRASFLNAMGRTVSGLSGAMTRVPAKVTLSTAMEYLLEDCTGAGHTLQEFIRQSLKRILTTGRMGIFVDPSTDTDALPRLIAYTEENIVNWREEDSELVLVVLRSVEYRQDKDDPYELIPVTVYQELFIDRDGFFSYRFWEPENINAREPVYKAGPKITPRNGGGGYSERIPFVFCSPIGTDASPVKPPLLDLCYLNRAHYMNSADLEHGRHWTSLPTPWVSGVDPDDYKKGLKIGSMTAWILTNTDARVGMLEFTGQGLGHLAEAIDEKQQQMALMGAKLLQPHRKQVESAELARMANAGDASILMGIALALGECINKALAIAAQLRNVSSLQRIEMNTDFVDIKLEPKEMEMLLLFYQNGVYSEEEFITQLALGERFKGDIDEAAQRLAVETEKRRLMGEMSNAGGNTSEQSGSENPERESVPS